MGGTLTTAQKEPFCSMMTDYYTFGSDYWIPSFDVVLIIAGTVFLFISYSVYHYEHLRSHPAPMIAALTAAEGFFCYMGASRYLVCGGGSIEGLAAVTIFWDSSVES